MIQEFMKMLECYLRCDIWEIDSLYIYYIFNIYLLEWKGWINTSYVCVNDFFE